MSDTHQAVAQAASAFQDLLAAIDALPPGAEVRAPAPMLAVFDRMAAQALDLAAQIRAGGNRPPIFSN